MIHLLYAIIAFLCAYILWTYVRRPSPCITKRHYHDWSMWSKPYKIMRNGYAGTDADQAYGTGEAYKYATYHQSRHCTRCGMCKTVEVSRTIYEGEKEKS